MSFAAAVSHVLTHYATFTGRARRSEYWWFVLAAGLTYLAASALDGALGLASSLGGNGLLVTVVALALGVPTLAVTVRRLHDVGRPGWWCVFLFVPIANIIMIIPLARDSGPANQHGPDPKARHAAHVA